MSFDECIQHCQKQINDFNLKISDDELGKAVRRGTFRLINIVTITFVLVMLVITSAHVKGYVVLCLLALILSLVIIESSMNSIQKHHHRFRKQCFGIFYPGVYYCRVYGGHRSSLVYRFMDVLPFGHLWLKYEMLYKCRTGTLVLFEIQKGNSYLGLIGWYHGSNAESFRASVERLQYNIKVIQRSSKGVDLVIPDAAFDNSMTAYIGLSRGQYLHNTLKCYHELDMNEFRKNFELIHSLVALCDNLERWC